MTNDEDDPRADGSGTTPPAGGDGDDIPLTIAGHEERKREREDTESLLGEGDEGEDEQEEQVEPVEVLVQLADDGEIDPWDIDIVAVTDKFLERLDEADLRTSGRALFYASVLLRMKSDAILEDDEEEEEPDPEPWEDPWAEDAPPEGPAAEAQPDPFGQLEREIDRRLERKRARGMPQTLDELVRDLREAERDNWWKESREYDTTESVGQMRHGTQELDYRSADDFRVHDEPTEDDVTGTAHGEDMDRIIEDVFATVRKQYEAGRDEVLFAEVSSVGGSRVMTYLGLLFLAHRGQIRLEQDDLFGDLWIQDPAAVGESGEAVAD